MTTLFNWQAFFDFWFLLLCHFQCFSEILKRTSKPKISQYWIQDGQYLHIIYFKGISKSYLPYAFLVLFSELYRFKKYRGWILCPPPGRRRSFRVSMIFSLPLEFLKILIESCSHLDIFRQNKVLALGTSTGMIPGYCHMIHHYTVAIDTRQCLKCDSNTALVNSPFHKLFSFA